MSAAHSTPSLAGRVQALCMSRSAQKSVVGCDWLAVERFGETYYQDPATNQWLPASKVVVRDNSEGQGDEGLGLLHSLLSIKKEPVASPGDAGPATVPSPLTFSFPPPPRPRTATLTATQPPVAVRAAPAASPSVQLSTAAAWSGASTAQGAGCPTFPPAKTSKAGVAAAPHLLVATAAPGNTVSPGCGLLARSDSGPGYSISLSPRPVDRTPPHPSCGEARSSGGRGSRHCSAAPSSPDGEVAHVDMAEATAAPCGSVVTGRRVRRPVPRLSRKIQHQMKTMCARKGHRLRMDHFGRTAVHKLEELGSEARQCCCLHYIDTLFDEEYCCGRRTRNVGTWVLEAVDKAARLFKDRCL
ncbi:hypothetical protein N2152v2_005485 [Parachlorella kessleri]